ncbi:MAG: DUF3552 domain-containing protein, partial [Planctomycetes bacterium]|nr:DUF3552 domain-containing protein [Planctomycetota bacterium]
MNILAQMGAEVFGFVAMGVALGGILVSVITKFSSKAKAKLIEEDMALKIETAKKEAKNIKKSAELDIANEILKKKEVFSAEVNRTKDQLREKERKLTKSESALERQSEQLSQKEKQFKESEKELVRKKQGFDSRSKNLDSLIQQQKNQLLKITSMDMEDARQLLLTRLEDECEHEMNELLQRKIEETKETVEEKSREVISTAIQRYAQEQTCEVSVSMVDIPSDDMKGRIIGREGRNIRAFEKATGVDVIVDD